MNNAGITRDATMRKMTEQQFDDVIQVHLRGCWEWDRQAAGIMPEIEDMLMIEPPPDLPHDARRPAGSRSSSPAGGPR